MAAVSMTVNGKSVTADVDPRTLLVQYLRENLRLTGTHVGCDTSQCGACVVHVNGKAIKSCTVLALQLEGANVLTIEGLAAADEAEGAVFGEEDFGGFGEGVVVFGAHGGAVGAGAFDDEEVADGGGGKEARGEGVGRAGGRGEEVAGFAAVADDEVFLGRAFFAGIFGSRDDDDIMLRAVEAGAEDFGHAGVELEELVAGFAGGGDVLDGADAVSYTHLS